MVISAELRSRLENTPYACFMGFRLLELAEGYARVAVTLRPEYANFLGATDGAFIMSLAEHAHACAASTLGPTRVGAQSSINFISGSGLQGELVAEARTIHAGRTLAITEVRVTDSSGKLLARATATSIARPS